MMDTIILDATDIFGNEKCHKIIFLQTGKCARKMLDNQAEKPLRPQLRSHHC